MGGKVRISFKFFLLWCLCLCLMGGLPGKVLAQDTDEADEYVLEEIMVTGSRIARDNDASASPIVTVDESLFDQSATSAIETQLNKLPQFGQTMDVPTFGGDIQPTARNTPGEATIALRGLGANRNLVLINGRRGTPANGAMYVDVNTIPMAAIQYVEAISGGASSTYGADAMAGVVNFIMKDSFDGLELDTQLGVTEEGDNFEYTVSGVMGSDLADDRGNVMMAFSYNKRNEAWQRDRDWYRNMWADPSIPGTNFFGPFSGFSTAANPPFDLNVLNTVIDGGTFTAPPFFTEIWVDDSGNAFTGYSPFYTQGLDGTSGADIADGYKIKMLDTGMYGSNNTNNLLILPMERFNLYTHGSYKINDWIGVFMQGYFSKNRTDTTQEPSPITSGWDVVIDPTINRDAIPSELLALLDTRLDPNAPFILDAMLPFDREGHTEVYTYNLIAGFEGTIPGIEWTYEAFVSEGESETSAFMSGFGSLQRFDAIINAGPNFGQGVSIKGNQGDPNYGFGAATATCTSGLNPFDWGSVTDDCWNAVLADIKSKSVMKQTIWELNTQGAVAQLPAGEMRGALGASYRKNDYEFQNDTMNTEGRSFIEQALGLYPADNSEGSIEAKEVYAEVLVPVLSDIPGFKQFNLELGGRHSDYDTTGGSNTYKAQFDWQTTDYIRFRGGYNRAERAPNIAELFTAPENTFGFLFGGDVCSYANPSPWSANPNTNPEHWADVVTLCGQLMEASGDPNADQDFYGVDYTEVAAGVAPTQPQDTSTLGFIWPHVIGNPNLTPEKADTWTLGVVIDSPFTDSPALSNLRIAIDYYSIKIMDAIGLQSGQIVLQQCFDAAFNSTFDINSPYCAGVSRNQDGNVGDTNLTFYNNGRIETSGIDIQIDWSMDAGPGQVGVNSKINYLLDMKSTELYGSNPLIDYTGTFGPTGNGLNGGSYEWKALTEFSYTLQNIGLRLALRWQFMSSMQDATKATFGSTTLTGASSYNLFDLIGNYQLLDNLSLRFGIENLFNKEPPLILRNTAPAPGTLPGGSFDTRYDTNGRRFYLGGRVTF